MGYQALSDLCDSFLSLSCLLRQRPAASDSTMRSPVWKLLLSGELDSGFGVFLGETHLATELMKCGNRVPGKTQAIRVRKLLHQSHCLLALRQRLVRIAQIPQRPGSKAVTHHASILPIERRMGAVLLGVVECHTLCIVRVR